MKLAIIGKGRMGSLLKKTFEDAGHEVLVCTDVFDPQPLTDNLSKLDMIVDFSHRDNLDWFLPLAIENGIALVEGTTALSSEQQEALRQASESIPVFYSANYSLGIAVLRRLAAQAAAILKEDWDIEITEKHHNQKADAPSGTALALLEAIDPDHEFEIIAGRSGLSGPRKKEIGMHAVRGGTVPGYHEIELFGKDEVLSLSHNAYSRQIFVDGALKAAGWLEGKPAGFYDMDSMIASSLGNRQ